jgi:hypothetical protein
MTPCTSSAAYPVFDIAEIAQEASERAGVDFRSGYDLRTARRAMELVFIEWANRGLNLWTIDGPVPIDLTPGVYRYGLPEDTVDLIEHVIRTWPSGDDTGQPSDLPLTRFTVSEYSAIPNKLAQGRPSLISIRRAVQPYFLLWQVPSEGGPLYQMVYWRLKRIAAMPPGGDAQPGIPWRFVNALTAGMAFYMALKSSDPKVMPKIQLLKSEYEEQFALASDEDRDRASFNFVPMDYSFIR